MTTKKAAASEGTALFGEAEGAVLLVGGESVQPLETPRNNLTSNNVDATSTSIGSSRGNNAEDVNDSRSNYYDTIPGIVRVLDIDYDAAALYHKRVALMLLTVTVLEIVVLSVKVGFASAADDDAVLTALIVVVMFGLAVILGSRARLLWLSHVLYQKRRIHVALTEEGIRQDLGQINASLSSLTMLIRYSEMDSVAVTNRIPWNACPCLAPKGGLWMMKVQRRSHRRRPFVVVGVRDGKGEGASLPGLEQLIRTRIQSAAPVEATADAVVHPSPISGDASMG